MQMSDLIGCVIGNLDLVDTARYMNISVEIRLSECIQWHMWCVRGRLPLMRVCASL